MSHEFTIVSQPPGWIIITIAFMASFAVSPNLWATPFVEAVKRGDLETMATLHSGAPNVLQERDSKRNTPLHWAARSGRSTVVQWLVKQGAEVDALNSSKATPLLNGAGHSEIVQILIKAGAMVNIQSESKMTPVMAAAATPGGLPAVRSLVEHGADVTVLGQRGLSALSLAVANDDLACVRFLVEHGGEINPKVGGTPLMAAAWHGYRAIVEWLLENGADPNLGSFHSGHSLNMAFYGQHPDVAAILVNHGADLEHRSPYGRHGTPPMVWAAYHEGGDTSVARLMIDKGADVNSAAHNGTTALDWARARHNVALEKLLLDAGAEESGRLPKQKAVPSQAVSGSPSERQGQIRRSIGSAIPLLQRSSDGFLVNKKVKGFGCVSCHQQTLPAVAYSWARVRGFKVDESSLARQLGVQLRKWKPTVEPAFEMLQPQPNPAVLLGYGLEGLAVLDYPANALTESMVWFLAANQQKDGHFNSNDNRPPMEDGAIEGTAFALRTMQRFPLPGREAECLDRVQRASRWLQKTMPVTFNQRVYQLLGLGWAKESSETVQPFVDRILALQQEDGGWSQLAGIQADAWATGQALVALHEAGKIPTSHPAYQRGIDFLLRTQFDDGSWWVRSRTWPFQPHFDSGFPHGKDQWISAGGTAWACMAMLLTQAVSSESPTINWANVERKTFGGPPQNTGDKDSPNEIAGGAVVDFTKQIQPLFERSCVSCHTGDRSKGGLDLASREGLVMGGDSGEPAFIPHDAESSLLPRYVADEVEDLEMPPLRKRTKYPALSKDEVSVIRAWIDEGAPWPEGVTLSAP